MPGSRKLLSPDEIHQYAAQAPHWKVVDGKKLVRTYTFPDFQEGLHLVNRVGAVAEEQGHHPDIHLSWGRVEIETWTHDAGGLTEQDFLLAGKIDRLG
jgi:4a-hydroxytetrahydrobiopterin dehydratase